MANSYILLIIVAAIYAGNLLVGKAVADSIPPITLAFLRLFIAFLILLPLGLKEWNQNRQLWLKEWKVIVILAFTGIAAFNTLLYYSLHFTSPINAGIVESSTPIFSVIIGFLLVKEKMEKRKLLGVFISMAGVLWVLSKGSLEVITSLSFNFGDILMCLAVIFWVLYSFVVKRHSGKFPLYGGLLSILFTALVIMIPFTTFEWNTLHTISWNWNSILSLLYLGIFPSVIALIGWNKAVENIGPSLASVFLNLVPVFAAIGSFIFFREAITWHQFFGGCVVLVGVYLTTKEKVIGQTTHTKLDM
ncbi:DMT family transporter [Bacillus luteolus]|uniref:DMT family transporter n=1 Tax=Litchfieldia luteola TaxID=682179 RepID=A0ABR9QKH4_9BACI|nr:DMT family transporter [Cytobacillus luteolus]MBE4909007.1 DMT family transporter [Cytobacillus luteolus]MBP1941866.1 drug/metabolite transporter (DMT)-like permease [Cytobacillus luteolus]